MTAMANLTNADAAKIRSTAQKLADIDIDIIANVRKLVNTISTFDKGWQSEVKEQFMQNWQMDAEALVEMMDQYGEIQELLFQAAQEFENTESELMSKVQQLK